MNATLRTTEAAITERYQGGHGYRNGFEIEALPVGRNLQKHFDPGPEAPS